ncbi:uncharacterized protein LOC125210303 [Salvia hispanica]|uniref:uncharacterized protein LOC125210303 n=1 Tax=Salvia hispanica TaxID=49212 RepID=UPI002009B2D6|nr:uncharacterized protein LOC125210303 [Salvia hispanica]
MASSSSDCSQLFEEVQNKLDSTMPWIGLYVAAATALCTLAMAADAFIGLRSKRYWLPSKCFSLNAFSLTILAVTMKLPVDLTSTDISSMDQYARISSLLFMSTCMNNFIISLGSMENNEIVLNIAALGVLVITITVNICIHIVQMHPFTSGVFYMLLPQIASLVIMLFFLVMSCCMSLMLPTARRYLELKYNEMHKLVSNRQLDGSTDEVGMLVKRYWVMAVTSDPQFVLARSAISSISALLCILITLLSIQVKLLTSLQLSNSTVIYYCVHNTSSYSWSIEWILKIQFLGVFVASIAPISRCFTALTIKVAQTEQKSFRDELKVDKYWTSKLVEWRDTSLPFQVPNRLCKKLFCDLLRFVLNFCIVFQILFVLAGKLLLFLFAIYGRGFYSVFCKNSIVGGSQGSRDGAQLDFSQYALLIEGEPKFPGYIIKNICNEADRLIKKGEENQSTNLIRLLKASSNFNGVGLFDSNRVPSLHSQEPPNCWSLPIVTLTTITVALTNIADDKANQLLTSVREGLSIVKIIEGTLDGNGELESIRKAADVVWVGVEVYRKWDYKDLDSTSFRGATHRETLKNLSIVAEKIVTEFMAQTRDVLMQSPLNWPVRVIAANSMYRIAKTILLWMTNGEHQSDDELLEGISITISDIIAACLTNLVQVITLKCHIHDIRERHESVRRALVLFGESKEIIEILRQREVPRFDVVKVATIDDWRASMALDIESPPESSDDATIVG